MSSSGKKNFHQSVNDQTLYVPVHSIEHTQLDYIVNNNNIDDDPVFSVYDTDSDNSFHDGNDSCSSNPNDNDTIEPVSTSNVDTNVNESGPPSSPTSKNIFLDTTVKRGLLS